MCGVDEIHTGIGKNGVVALIHGKKGASSERLGLRADMNALPITEQNDFAWKSTRPGMMHGCGHDGHAAMLVDAARYLSETVYAMHNWPQMRPDTVGVNPGSMMAAAERITIEIPCKGDHGAHPFLAVDPVLVTAHIITVVQSIVSRNVRAIERAVVSLCAMQPGDMEAFSVVPARATLAWTVRGISAEVRDLVERRLHELYSGVALGLGASVHVSYERIYRVTINSEAQARFAAAEAQKLVGHKHVNRNIGPSMGAGKFYFMLQAKAGAYLRLGQGVEGTCVLHNTRCDFDDDMLPLAAALHASLVEHGLPLQASA